MSLWGRISAALRRTDPARLLGVGEAELARSARLEGSAAITVLDRAIAAFQAADLAGAGERAAMGLAAALWARGDKGEPAEARLYRARAVAHLKAQVTGRPARRDPAWRARVLAALSRAWLPFGHDDPQAPATLPLLVQARDAQSAAVASLSPGVAHDGPDEDRADIWAEALLALALRDLAVAEHPHCAADVARDSRTDAGRALAHLTGPAAKGVSSDQRARAAALRARL